MSIPSIKILPSVGISSPAIILNNVVLPEPEAPRIEKSSPFLMSRSTLLTAMTSPKCLLISLI